MKILAFSDLHLARDRAADLVESSQTAELVIGAGDFCNHRKGLDRAMDMLAGITAPFVAVPGNAESIEELKQAAPPGMFPLHGEGIDLAGLKIFGLGYGVPPTPFGDWSCDLTELEAETYMSRCDDADILVLHSPPKGIADRTSAGASVGSTSLRDAIIRVQPKLAFCGHIHDSWGVEGTLGKTRIVNLGPRPNWFDISAN